MKVFIFVLLAFVGCKTADQPAATQQTKTVVTLDTFPKTPGRAMTKDSIVIASSVTGFYDVDFPRRVSAKNFDANALGVVSVTQMNPYSFTFHIGESFNPKTVIEGFLSSEKKR